MVRYKKRYLLVEISFTDGKVDERILSRLIYKTVKNAVISAHGDYGMACVDRSLQGTLLSCQKFLIHHNKEELFKLLQQCKTPAERRKISKTLKKAEKHTLPLNPFNTKKRRTSTTLDVPPDEDFDSN